MRFHENIPVILTENVKDFTNIEGITPMNPFVVPTAFSRIKNHYTAVGGGRMTWLNVLKITSKKRTEKVVLRHFCKRLSMFNKMGFPG